MREETRTDEATPGRYDAVGSDGGVRAPTINLPKGGGAIKGIGEKFAANPVTGTGSLSIPITVSPARGGFGPQPMLNYDSGAGNGPFGMGWSLGLPAITRKTDKGLPRYDDADESDVFILSGAEDLVPVLVERNGAWVREILPTRTVGGVEYRIQRYRPRVEGSFARIERWADLTDGGNVFWRSISRDNVTSWYGRTAESRIADPADPGHIFSWLLCLHYDDRGNVVSYGYKPEDDEGIGRDRVSEHHRVHRANRYPKRIRYGNHTPYVPVLAPEADWPAPPADDQWYFELVFDYGEHDRAIPLPQDTAVWASRPDPFSSYRSGFEVRTHRLCRRALMFHHFPEEPEVGANCLVRSTDFTYAHDADSTDENNLIYTKLSAVAQLGYRRQDSGYRSRSLPPVEFGYSVAEIHSEVRELDCESLVGMPAGLSGGYQWIDLDGEGLPGGLSEAGDAWFYKRNLSPVNMVGDSTDAHIEARFAPTELVTPEPASRLGQGVRFVDLAGDGHADVVRLDGTVPGFYRRGDGANWETFRPFRELPNRDWNDPNLRFLDLDGDGLTDVLITEQDMFAWHPSLGEDGFGQERRVPVSWDETTSPATVFNDSEQTVHLADMSGDGLTDLVRIRNGEVCYWPNLGYGRFGAKVIMDNAPWFDHPDQFDSRRVLIADIDGSGTADIIYLQASGICVYLNQSGNGWANPLPLNVFPPSAPPVTVQVYDLLGNGTACLVWSSPLPDDAAQPVRYIDLMGGVKPHLLTTTKNNLGAETEIGYAPSTKFYLQDKLAGNPWATRLPFPVHVVERVAVHDRWRNTTFASTYSYHHGYFDGPEREFRGFGRVEQVDSEAFGAFTGANSSSPFISRDHHLFQPPVKTVTWFHTGAPIPSDRFLHQLGAEYFPNSFQAARPESRILGTFQEHALPDPDIGALDLTPDEHREALRACRGRPLRQEVYELDAAALGSGRQTPVRIFTATTHACHIRRVQPRNTNRHAVLLATESESIGYHYELDLRPAVVLPDPRIVHTLNLRIDEFGNPEQAVTVGYPRRQPMPLSDPLLPTGVETLAAAVQGELHLGYTETRYTGDVAADPDNYRLRLPCETQASELTGITPAVGDGHYFSLAHLQRFALSDRYPVAGGISVEPIPYHQLPNRTRPQRRQVESTRSLFFDDTLAGPLPSGTVNSRALPYETYTLALTEALLDVTLGDKLTPEVTAILDSGSVSGYLSGPALIQRLGADTAGQRWRRSGIAGFTIDAAQHFYLPERYTDPFGNVTVLDYDPRDLHLRASTDALGNRIEVTEFDFRVLAPRQIRDTNGNFAEVRFDLLGLPAVTALSGKQGEGDSLEGFDGESMDPDPASIVAFFVTDDYDPATAKAYLRGATSRSLYYLGEMIRDGAVSWGHHPPCAASIMREQHAEQLPESPVQAAFEYSCGTGSIVVKKIQAEPESAGDPPRWVANGKTIVNNKGKPVKQYEPYFSPSEIGHRYEEPREIGVTSVFFYDAVGRTIRTDAPDGSFGRVEFSPWHSTTLDANDTVLEPGNAWYARMSGSPVAAERRAAHLAAAHAGTPGATVVDSLGRTVLRIAHNRTNGIDEKYVTFTKLDAEGKPLWTQDPRGNRVMQYVTPPLPAGPVPFDDPANLAPEGIAPCYDISGLLLFQHSTDGGDRWMVHDAAGTPLLSWNSRGFRTRMTYDALHRPIGVFVTAAGDSTLAGTPRDVALPPEAEVLVEQRVYGETNPDADKNLRGRLFEVYDSSGVTTSANYDFTGNLLTSSRRFAREYRHIPDWSVLTGLTDPDRIAAVAEPLLESAPALTTQTRYDALNRPTTITAPDASVYRATYNEANLIERVEVNLRGATTATAFVTNVDYNAKGQRVRIDYGNGATTTCAYDTLTFRLTGMRTTRPAALDATAALLFARTAVIQDLGYTYDPIGNITRLQDAALTTTPQAGAASDFVYDALYRLVGASGREHSGQTEFALSPADSDRRDYPFAGARIHPNDLRGLRGYTERYRYDAVGNIMQLVHGSGSNVDHPGQTLWQRRYQYAIDSNRVLATSVPGDPSSLPDYTTSGGYSSRYGYDAHGNITSMTHLPLMRWNHRDLLCASTQQVVTTANPEITYYIYDSGGQRVRKVTETATGARKNQRLYLGGFEVYREFSGDAVALERQTLHVMDDKQRVAIVETSTIPAAAPRIRYQYGNHLGSSNVELDEAGALVSYEEYHPYGTTSFQTGSSAAEVSLKRYRYTGKERDSENGFGYHGARYYAPWIARWASCDPAGGPNVFVYCAGNPVVLYDPDGLEERPAEMYQAEVTGQETQEQVHQMFAARGIFYSGNAEWVKTDGGGYWNIDRSQVQAREIGTQLNMRADVINGPKAPPKPKSDGSTPAQRLQAIKDKQDANFRAATRGMWDEAVDQAFAFSPFPTEILKFGGPVKTGDYHRDLELQDNYESGQSMTTTVALAATLVPVGEIVEGAQLAAGKLPKPTGGLGMIGGQEFKSFSEVWADGAKDVGGELKSAAPKFPIKGNPQTPNGPGGALHGQKMQEIANVFSHEPDVKQGEVYMHSAWSTFSEVESLKKPDVAMVGESGGITVAEVPSPSDLRTAKSFGSLIARNLKEMRKLGDQAEGLFIIFSDTKVK